MRELKNLTARGARWSASHRKVAIFGWLAFVAAALVVGGTVGTQTLDYDRAGVGDSGEAELALDDAFPETSSEVVLVESTAGAVATDRSFRSTVEEVIGRLEAAEGPERIVSPYESGTISSDGRAVLIEFEIAGEDEDVEELIDPILVTVHEADEESAAFAIGQFGDASANAAIGERFEEDFRKAEFTAVPVTLLILLVAFGSLVAAGIPLLLGITAVAATIGLVGPISQLFPVDESITSVILLIGLAVGVDYSLFYLRREREERASGHDEDDSLLIAAATSGRAVLVSGLTVMIAMAGMYLAGAATFQSFATGTILVVAIALVGSLTVLPALLAWLGDRVEKGRVPWLGKRKSAAGESRLWGVVLRAVLRRPWVSALAAGGFLLVLALPVLGLKTALPGIETLPRSIPEVQTYDRIQASFPGDQVRAIPVVEAADVRAEPVASAIAELRTSAARSELFLGRGEVEVSPDGSVAEIAIPIVGDGTNEESKAALAKLREELVPAAFADVPKAEVNVAGFTAGTEDFNQVLGDNLPYVFAFVLGMAFILLLITFRSIVVPLKAILLNLLSVGAAYGILVLIFQDGHGEELLGFESTGAIASWLPLFLFVVLFGLSMDYHVFIISRIREAVDRGASTEEAVSTSIRSTAGVITSAAAIMIAVFAIFATLSMIEFKQMGIGLGLAVLIDATIIRGVLLPSVMKLLGDANWYLPSWLEWLPRVTPAESSPEPLRASG